ncbi:MAG TPA: hypothetical protein VK741_25765 [Acetobacteraceae bacterium]|nr:hypothetical protein [Acetobacteraceae bacterium]
MSDPDVTVLTATTPDQVIASGFKILTDLRAKRTGPIAPGLIALAAAPDALAAAAAEYAQDLLRAGDAVRPTIGLFTAHGEAMLRLNEMPAQPLKVAIAAMLRVLIAATPIIAYWIAFEAWSARNGPESDPALAGLAPIDRPDRTEAVMIVSAAPGAYRASAWPIDRAGAVTLRPPMPEMIWVADNPILDNLFAPIPGSKLAARFPEAAA